MLLAVVSAFLLALCCSLAAADLDWWQTAVFYQIYPRSFQDSNGDGVGDLKGIEQRLQHLKDIGVSATWLSPILKSPMADFGYDIANFTEVDPLFGTMEDFESLLGAAKRMGIKLILDFVPNHSSDQGYWFQQSVKRVDPYTNYFVWHDGKIDPDTGKRVPPNNWISVFHGSAWEWNEERGQYYLHEFLVQQPDLNYRDPNLVQEMKDALRFWLDKGVDGFRVDAVPYLFEDEQLRDEPRSFDPNATPDDNDYLLHLYTNNQEGTYDMIAQWRELLDEYKARDGETRVMMVEAYAPFNETMRYFGTEDRPVAHFPFNFAFINRVNENSTAQDFDDNVHSWMDNLPKGVGHLNWVVGNHDNHRVASRYGPALADGMNMLVLLMPGTAVTYNGEEIAMTDTFVSWEDTKDPAAINAGKDRYLLFTRDPERTPFQWDNTTSGGFSTSGDTWLPMNPNYQELNVESQKADSSSHYNVYRALTQTRQHPTIQRGSTETRVLAERVFSFSRSLEHQDTFLVVLNLGEDTLTVDLSVFSGISADQMLQIHVSGGGSGYSNGRQVEAGSVKLNPKGAIVLKTIASWSPALL